MAYTLHGKQIPDTPVEGPKPNRVARCGGPLNGSNASTHCRVCTDQAIQYKQMMGIS